MIYVFLFIREVYKTKNEMVGKESIKRDDILLISKCSWLNHPCEQLYCEHMLLPSINVI